MRTLLFISALLLFNNILTAQQKWEVGLLLGGINYQGDLLEDQYPDLQNTNLAYGLLFKKNLHNEWALRANFYHGKLTGSDRNNGEDSRLYRRGLAFETAYTEASLRIEWEPFGNKRYPDQFTFHKIISPVFFAGLGTAIIDPQADFSASPELIQRSADKDLNADYNKILFTIPVGTGLKIDLGRNAFLGLELGLNLPHTDFLDGISNTANPNKKDINSFVMASYVVRFGTRDIDKDGIVDKEDLCPRTAGQLSADGCPDEDGDTVEDLEDICPEVAGIPELNGCPDGDGDLVIDTRDNCPDTPGLEELDGCPDTDEDGIADIEDLCPDSGGLVDENGCPLPDTDEDGIVDRDDPCPDVKGEFSGCPDTDEDGLADHIDPKPNDPLNTPDSTQLAVLDTLKMLDSIAIVALNDTIITTDTSLGAVKFVNPTPTDLAEKIAEVEKEEVVVATKETTKELEPVLENIETTETEITVIEVEEEVKLAKDTVIAIVTEDIAEVASENIRVDTFMSSKMAVSNTGSAIDSLQKEVVVDLIEESDIVSSLEARANTLNENEKEVTTTFEDKEKEIILNATKRVQFKTNSYGLETQSIEVLEELTMLFDKYPDFLLRINGHTDSVGKHAYNQSLSLKRAKACYDYLILKGIANERLTYKGYGEDSPIADNTLPEGRGRNRRVEFIFYTTLQD